MACRHPGDSYTWDTAQMMKLKAQQVFDATQVLARIINENRALPSKGKYRIARMHAKLFPEFTTANEQRTAKIASYDHKAWVTPEGRIVPAEEGGDAKATEQAAVPDDKMAEFVAWWAEIAAVEIDVNVEPIPIEQLSIDGLDSSISYAEFATLGELVG